MGNESTGKEYPLSKLTSSVLGLNEKVISVCRDNVNGADVPGGFRIVEEYPLEIRPMTENYFRKVEKTDGKVHRAYHGSVQFRGTLEVTNQAHFSATYHNGIGSAKGFGLGLFLLAPVNL